MQRQPNPRQAGKLDLVLTWGEAETGLRREDVVIILTEVKAENWSFGNGIAT